MKVKFQGSKCGGPMTGWHRHKLCNDTFEYTHPNRRGWSIRRYPHGGWAVYHGQHILVTWELRLDLAKIWVQAQPLWLRCNEPPFDGRF